VARTELPWLLWDRLVRPFPFAASLANALLAANIVSGQSVFGDTADLWSTTTAAAAMLAAMLLWAGWWLRSSALMQAGLAATVIVSVFRSTYIGLGTGGWLTAGISYAWGLAAAGAWLLERTTGHGGDVG
jgi:hypothetical protein